MKLTQEVIDKIQEAMLHTKMNGDVNWQDGDEIDVCLGGTFAGDKFISIINRTRSNTTKRSEMKFSGLKSIDLKKLKIVFYQSKPRRPFLIS